MARLFVRLLGAYHVELDGEAIYGFETDKARALLAYLIVEADRPHRREVLASLLWPERPEIAARANLRQALSRVRRALDDRGHSYFLFTTPTDVQFNAASDYAVDVAELEAFAASPARHRELLPEPLCADFLPGLSVPDSEAFQIWLLQRQEGYHRLAIEILDEQNVYFDSVGDFEKAAAAARLQLRLEPWLEEAHRRYMRDLALAGHRDEALHHYDVCRRALQNELGVEPAARTQALWTDIRMGALAAPYGVGLTLEPSGPVERRPSRLARAPAVPRTSPVWSRAYATGPPDTLRSPSPHPCAGATGSAAFRRARGRAATRTTS